MQEKALCACVHEKSYEFALALYVHDWKPKVDHVLNPFAFVIGILMSSFA